MPTKYYDNWKTRNKSEDREPSALDEDCFTCDGCANVFPEDEVALEVLRNEGKANWYNEWYCDVCASDQK